MKSNILNLGCGKDSYGNYRVDLYQTPVTTHVLNIDKERLPFPNDYFDEVKFFGVLEHMKNMGFVLDEIYRVLKVGGKLNLRTDHAGFIGFYIFKKLEHSKITERWYNIDYFGHHQGEDHHYHLFVESHLRALLKEYKEIKVEYFHMNPNSWKGWLLKMLPKNLGASQIDVYAIK